MQVKIQGHGLEVTPNLKDYVDKKIAKIERFFKNIQKAEVILDVRDINDANKRHVAEVSMWVSGKKVLRATEGAKDMYSAIDLVFKEIEGQTKRHKEKHVEEVRREAESIKDELEGSSLPPEKPSTSIMRVSRFSPKPLTREDAIEELKLSKDDFMVFRNADTHSFNVIYKAGNKGFELIEPEKEEFKSFSPEDAAGELGKVGKNFFVFKNLDTGGLNVIFRRKTGNFGLIEPEY
ncbi:MAG: ribosome-associated translation inhibitor RaiA [Candidatus Saganbacteria bacterium]|nr:ribosome-associated translation inhibitor RaiA [Candidatus Saganbacteria bacterium]